MSIRVCKCERVQKPERVYERVTVWDRARLYASRIRLGHKLQVGAWVSKAARPPFALALVAVTVSCIVLCCVACVRVNKRVNKKGFGQLREGA